jgi:hypothetical protein
LALFVAVAVMFMVVLILARDKFHESPDEVEW